MGRRKAAADASGDAPSAKKTRSGSGLVEGLETRWEFEDQPGKWVPYSDDFHKELITAYNGKRKEIALTLPDGKTSFVVNFQKSVQKNKKTSYEKRFRACFKDESGSDDFMVWQWEDEHGKWNPYAMADSLHLEKAHRKGESTVDIVALHRSYTLNLKTMEQENTVTKVKRKVERARVGDTAANGATGTPAATATSSSATSASATSASATASIKQEEEEEEEDAKPAAKSTARGGRGKSKAASGVKKEEEEAPKKSTMRTLVKKTKAPVDSECSIADRVHIFCEGNDVWDCMLNQTNVGNNNNKYFMIQLLEDDGKKSYHTWFRWGRVGYKGQNNLTSFGPNLDGAKKAFCKKFSDKTKNEWSLRKSFVKVPGKYDLLEMDYDTKEKEEEDTVDGGPGASGEPAKVPDSTLDTRLQDLINLICDVKSMEDAMVELKYDAKKAPLGKLTADQIKAGYAALKKVEACVEKNDFGQRLVHACNEFYTRIPHNFGMRTPPLIRSKQEIKEKLQLLEALEDIEIAIKKLKQGDLTLNPVDRHYQSLELDLETLDHGHSDFKLIEEYLTMTHASTHNQYKMQLLDVFTCHKDTEFQNFVDHGNRMLLWHGSRLTNWVGILSQGLRIAPPEAPVTGYMFGKGVYFADMSSKSANYCFASHAKNVALLLLCEVSLGTVNQLLNADYKADKLPAGKHSVQGLGKVAPDPASYKKLSDGTVVPVGKGVDSGVVNPTGFTLNYNEFIVYDTKQIKMRYLLKVKFNFK